jgi:hypothetical protein
VLRLIHLETCNHLREGMDVKRGPVMLTVIVNRQVAYGAERPICPFFLYRECGCAKTLTGYSIK